MTKEQLFDAIGETEEVYIRDAGEAKKKRTDWITWGAVAACLVLVVGTVLWQVLPREQAPDSVACDDLPGVEWRGQTYHSAGWADGGEMQLPEGWELSGLTAIDGEMRKVYTHPDYPLWLYIYEQHHSVTSADTTYWVYQRYVHEALLSRHFIRYQGQLYIRLYDVQMIGDSPDEVDMELYHQVKWDYDWRFEGALPEGFVSAGEPFFTGANTLPDVELGTNVPVDGIFVNPDVPEVLLTPCRWFSAGQTVHDGYTTFILYSGPLA